jgi:hypothetical protein
LLQSRRPADGGPEAKKNMMVRYCVVVGAFAGVVAGCDVSSPPASSAEAADGGEASPVLQDAAFSAADGDAGAGASAADASAVFTFDLTRASAIDIEARGPNGPLAGVLVSIRNAPAAGDEVGPVLWMGVSGHDGHARGSTRTEHVTGMVFVTIHKMGWSGPWSDPALRIKQGLLAPSGYVVVRPAALSTLRVDLTQVAQ